MKTNYFILTFFLFSILTFSQQNYEFGLIHISNNNFKVVAIPNFDSSGNTDVSDVGFTLMLPAGASDITDITGLLSGRTWSINRLTAETLTTLGGDGTEDGNLLNCPPGQTILAHTSGEQIDLVSFSISNMPTTGEMRLLYNTEIIAINTAGALDSFYNSNIDGTTTQNYFSGFVSGLESFNFETLSTETVQLEDSSIQVYPNPASDYLNIATKHTIKQVEVFDVLGKKVKQNISSNKINVSQLLVGIYIVKVFTDKGQITKKIVIE